jgi:hypothetical protein
MRHLRASFNVRSLLVAVAMVGVNLAGAIATSKYYPRSHFHVGGGGWGSAFFFRDQYGLIYTYVLTYDARGRALYRLKEVVREPLPPTLLHIWAPVMASVSITLLVLAGSWSGRASGERDPASIGNGERLPFLFHLGPSARRITIAAALIGLNVAALPSRPPPDRSQFVLDYRALFGGTPTIIIFELDGGSVQPRPVYVSDPSELFVDLDVYRSSGGRHRLDEGTMAYKPDGSIMAYAGCPERMLSQPCLMRSSTRPPLGIWSPVVASASGTALVLFLLWRRSQQPQTDPVTETDERDDRSDIL